MKLQRRLLSCLALFLVSLELAAQTPRAIPDAPSLWREVTGVRDTGSFASHNVQFLRPHLPAWRTTADGRLGIICEGTGPTFGLFLPEKLTTPVLKSSDTAATMIEPTHMWSVPSSMIDFVPDAGWGRRHVCLWDAPNQPQAVGNDDVYSVYVVVTATSGDPDYHIRIYTTPVKVTVSNPKTSSAMITSVVRDGPTIAGATFEQPHPTLGSVPISGNAFEPVVAANGQLFIVRINDSDATWNFPPNTANPTQPPAQMVPGRIDVVYAWSDTPNAVADPNNWTEFFPVALAPYDSRINTTVGFALAPFRDATGKELVDPSNVYTDTEIDLGGSYPWIDRKGDNLFFETIRDKLSIGTVDPNNPQGRYPHYVHGMDQIAAAGAEAGGATRGVAYVGKWSHGKIVQLDNLNNDMDYAIGSTGNMTVASPGVPAKPGPQQRVVDLYNAGTGASWWGPTPMGTWSDPSMGELLLGYGRGTVLMPLGENDNANIIDSFENKLNHRPDVFPLTPRDVVWHMNNSKQTDELVFDDSLEPDALIVAHMTGLTEYISVYGSSSTPTFKHHTGWGTSSFTDFPRLSNSATAPASRWSLPAYGQVLGNGRVEPAANGGMFGKGFWMDGSIGIEFTVPSQPAGQSLTGHEWYVGLFVDARFPDDTSERTLLTFPDGTSVKLYGRSQVLFVDALGDVQHRATIPPTLGGSAMLDDLLPDNGWAHIGLQIRDEGTRVELLLNGLPLSRWEALGADGLFTMVESANITIGAPNLIDGFVGWVDEFKVFAHAMDPESACNHAGGTLIGLEPSYTGMWKSDFADRYPNWVHDDISDHLRAKGEPTFAQYACFYDTREDLGVDLFALKADPDITPLRDAVLFPEGPLFHDAPRPSSVTNAFCLTCHHPGAASGLDVNALALIPGLTAANDPRRQPSQSPSRVHGHVPVNPVDDSPLPGGAFVAPPSGQSMDEYTLGSWSGPATVQSFTLLDRITGRELLDMPVATAPPYPAFPVLDYSQFGTFDWAIRANLDSAQGAVDMTWNGQPVVTLTEPPYEIDCDLATINLSGLNVVTAVPSGGAGYGTAFSLLQATGQPRVIADYGSEFREFAPAEGWLYGWNAKGLVMKSASFRSMNWYDGASRYTHNGLAFPEVGNLGHGSFNASGGHPGLGHTQGGAGNSLDRYAMVGYRARTDGWYSVGGLVTPNNVQGAIEVHVYHQVGVEMIEALAQTTGAGDPLKLDSAVSNYLSAGDVIWVAVGPDGVNSYDGFQLDLQILFHELQF